MPQHLSQLIQLQTLSSFVVGFDEGCKIDELGPLRNLKGKLNFFCLERVKSRNEAVAANLVEKENISDLYFQWNSRCDGDVSLDNDLNVLEELQPHKNLQGLKIQNFAGELLPSGIFVENLVEIYLQDCNRCETLPMLGQLSKLEVLPIRCLHNVKSIGDEFYGNYINERTLFPKLKTFHLLEMNSLEHWEEIATTSNCTKFPHLENLSLSFCQKLRNIPNFFASDSNARLFPRLRSLRIFKCEKLTKLPNWLELCSSLEDMSIHNCPNDALPNLQQMQNLSSLGITHFQKLPALACNHNLRTLKVDGSLQDFDWSSFLHLTSLENLELFDRDGCMLQLPRQLEHLAALRSFYIGHFNGEVLPEWFENFTCLCV